MSKEEVVYRLIYRLVVWLERQEALSREQCSKCGGPLTRTAAGAPVALACRTCADADRRQPPAPPSADERKAA